jgi:hypothetical protein
MKRIAVLLFLLGNILCTVSAQYLVEATDLEAFDRSVIVDNAFVNYIWIMDELALENNLEIKVQGNGFREADQPVRNAIVPPSATSNHLVGHAIDINIVYNGVWYASGQLRNYEALPQAIKNFISGCIGNGLRWGGFFSVSDPVHFDDDFYQKYPQTYNELYLEYQR